MPPWNDERFQIWLQHQRVRYQKKTLSQDRIDKLKELGYIDKWDEYKKPDVVWREKFDVFKEATETNKKSYTTKDPIFGTWVHRQKDNYAHNKLSQDKIDLLDTLKPYWVWPVAKTKTNDELWVDVYEPFKIFTEASKKVIPQTDKQFGNWIHTQKKNYKANKLSQDKIDLLNNLGIYWKW